MKKLRGTVIIAASAALVAAGVLAAAGSAGTTAIAPGNLAFAGVDPSDGMLDIYVAKSDGTAQSNITNDTSIHKDSSPVWSPEGRKSSSPARPQIEPARTSCSSTPTVRGS